MGNTEYHEKHILNLDTEYHVVTYDFCIFTFVSTECDNMLSLSIDELMSTIQWISNNKMKQFTEEAE